MKKYIKIGVFLFVTMLFLSGCSKVEKDWDAYKIAEAIIKENSGLRVETIEREITEFTSQTAVMIYDEAQEEPIMQIYVYLNNDILELRKSLYELGIEKAREVFSEENYGVFAAKENPVVYEFVNKGNVRIGILKSEVSKYEKTVEEVLTKFSQTQTEYNKEEFEACKKEEIEEINEAAILEKERYDLEIINYFDNVFSDYELIDEESLSWIEQMVEGLNVSEFEEIKETTLQRVQIFREKLAIEISSLLGTASVNRDENLLSEIKNEIGNMNNNYYDSYKVDWNKLIESTEKAIEVDKENKKPIKPGNYKVGNDIEAGNYVILGSGYFEVCSKSNCDIRSGELLYNKNFKNRAYVSLKEGQYFNYSGSGSIYKEAGYTATLSSSFDKPGYYLIGSDLEAGEYKLSGSGYFAICTKPRCDIKSGELTKNDNLKNGGYVTVKKGNYLVISGSLTGEKQ